MQWFHSFLQSHVSSKCLKLWKFIHVLFKKTSTIITDDISHFNILSYHVYEMMLKMRNLYVSNGLIVESEKSKA